jgi:hypothetical protein
MGAHGDRRVNFRVAQVNFSRGEIAPHLYGRFDVDAWQSGLKRARNVFVLKYGGVCKRPGTELVAEVIDASSDNRLMPFQFSLTQAYVLEWGNLYMAPIADGGRVLDGSTPYQIVTPYTGAQLPEVDYDQTADTVYLAHLDHAPSKLLRHGNTDWEVVSLTFGPSIVAPTDLVAEAFSPNTDSANSGAAWFPLTQSYVVTAYNDDTGQESRASEVQSVTNDLTLKRNYNSLSWSAVTSATRYNLYKADETQFYGYIGTTEELTFTDANIGPALDKAPPQAYNPFPAAGDYPSTVALHQQRLLWGRTSNVPHGVFGSRIGSTQLENMDRSRPARADDSFSLAISAGKVNAVNHLVPTTGLVALTSDAIFSIDGDGSGGSIQANSAPQVRRQSGRNASRLKPLLVDNVIFYTPAAGSAVRTIGYDFSIDGLKSNDVSIFSPHFLEQHSIVSWCHAQEPRSLIWAAREDGALLCFTWEQEQNVWGWTMCETDGLVKSVCSIFEGGEDRVYLIVERVVDGVTRRFIERMASQWWTDESDWCFVDCAVRGDFETGLTTFSGLDHLEGRTDVAGIVDGYVVTGLTVTGGEVTLPSSYPAAKKVIFGIPYSASVETLPYRTNAQGIGVNIGRSQNVGAAVLMLKDTRQIMAGIDSDHLFSVKSRMTEAYAAPDDLMNGDYLVNMDNKASDHASVYIQQDAPTPFTLLGIAYDPVING